MSTTVYVLACQYGKYYVGKTSRAVDMRLEEHSWGEGSEWTRLYKPLRVIQTIRNADALDEDACTKYYMKEFGIDNVRGGSYSMVKLPDYKVRALQDELASMQDACFRCGKKGHFASSCRNQNTYDNAADYDYSDDDEEDDAADYDYSDDEEDGGCDTVCYRCGRHGHWASSCYARTDVSGHRL